MTHASQHAAPVGCHHAATEEGECPCVALIAALFMLGPRAAIFIWWLIEPGRWALAFDTVLWPIAGFLVAPWTTLMYLAVFPGGIEGLDYLWLGIGVAFDLFTLVRRRLHEPEPDADREPPDRLRPGRAPTASHPGRREATRPGRGGRACPG